jgi:hypothetical protein
MRHAQGNSRHVGEEINTGHDKPQREQLETWRGIGVLT